MKSNNDIIKKIENKVMTSKDAISKFVDDNDVVFLGGFGHLYPYSLAHEVIRQGKKELTLCKHSPEIVGEQMIGTGLIKKIIFSWFGNPGVGSARCFRRAVEKGIPRSIEVEEYTHFSLNIMIKAGAQGLPFLPSKALFGTNIVDYNKNIKFLDCPFTGEKLCLVPAIKPDVALIHVQRADVYGNSQAWGITADITDGAFASKKVIVSAEEIVPTEVIRRDPNRTVIPSFKVDAVIESPWGAHPSYAQGYYDRDNDYYILYDKWSRTQEDFEKFLDEWVYGVKNRTEYLEKLGVEKILKLKAQSHMSFPVDYGYYV
jgi:glutaconate CoA-transferase subunit A